MFGKKQKSILFMLVSITSASNTAELRIGMGSYNWNMGISELMKASADMNSKVLSIVETHKNFSNSKYYFEYSGDFYWNKFSSNIETSIKYQEAVDVTGLGNINTTFVENKDYKTSKKKSFAATDINFGIGYDLFHENNNYFAIGINAGYVSPSMKLKNKKIKKKILKKLDTEISLYKVGVSLKGQISLSSNVLLKGNAGFGFTKGTMKNKWLDVSKKVDGNFKVLDMSINYKPSNSNYYVCLGILHKSWSVDKTEIDISKVLPQKPRGMYELDFSTNYVYLGIGYTF